MPRRQLVQEQHPRTVIHRGNAVKKAVWKKDSFDGSMFDVSDLHYINPIEFYKNTGLIMCEEDMPCAKKGYDHAGHVRRRGASWTVPRLVKDPFIITARFALTNVHV